MARQSAFLFHFVPGGGQLIVLSLLPTNVLFCFPLTALVWVIFSHSKQQLVVKKLDKPLSIPAQAEDRVND